MLKGVSYHSGIPIYIAMGLLFTDFQLVTEGQLKCRAVQLSVEELIVEPQHCLMFLRSLCKCKFSMALLSNNSSNLLFAKSFVKSFILDPENQG